MKIQEKNPNNARVRIDFNDFNNPVKFEYVGNRSPFMIAYILFLSRILSRFLLSFVFLDGIIIGFYYRIPEKKLLLFGMFFFTLLFCLVIFPSILAFLFSKTRLIKYLPYIQASGKTKYYAEFKPENIIENKIELPLYSNVFLRYKLEGDFIKKIDKIEITEHPFSRLVFKGFFKVKKELKPNEYLWKAVFLFKEVPKDGSLKIMFH